jgi:hypothetical protein
LLECHGSGGHSGILGERPGAEKQNEDAGYQR